MAPNYESVLGRYLHDNNDAALARRVASELVFLDPGFMKRIAKGPQSEEMSSLALEMVTRSENQIVKLQRDIEVGDVALVCKLNEYIHDWPLPKLFPLFKAALKSDELVYKDLTAELIEKQGEHLKTISFLNLLDADGPARPDLLFQHNSQELEDIFCCNVKVHKFGVKVIKVKKVQGDSAEMSRKGPKMAEKG